MGVQSVTPTAEAVIATEPAAPAPPKVSAQFDAATKSDFSAFTEAHDAKLRGKPLPPVEAKAAIEAPVTSVIQSKEAELRAAAVQKQPQGPSEKDRAADDRVRRIVAEAVTTKDSEISELRARLARFESGQKPEAITPPASAAAEKFATIEEWSKSNPQGTMDDFLNARDTWRENQTTAAKALETHFAELKTQSDQFATRMTKALDAEPDLASKIPPAMCVQGVDVLPISALSPAQRKTAKFTNLVAEVAMRSDHPAEFLKYLHTNRSEVERVAQAGSYDTVLLGLSMLDGRSGATAPTADGAAGRVTPLADTASALPSTITAAPPPVPSLNRPGTVKDPKKSAFDRAAKGDDRAFGEWLRLDNEERMAKARARSA